MNEGIAIVPRTITTMLATALLTISVADTAYASTGSDSTVALASVAIGSGETWVVGTDGHLKGWGQRYCDTQACLTPADIPSISLPSPAVEVVTNGQRSAVRLADGSVLEWGSSLADTQAMQSMPFTQSVVELGMGEDFLCARYDDGDVSCLGLAGTPAPAWLDAFDFTDQALGLTVGAHHACAQIDLNTVSCWGDEPSASMKVELDVPVRLLTAGGGHTCALTDSGEVWCWGLDDEGQLGHDTSGVAPVPLPEPISSITAGAEHTCAVGENGNSLYCWGSDAVGQLGVGTELDDGIRQLDMGGHEVSEIHAGPMGYTTFVVLNTGGLRGWGLSDVGQTGYGDLFAEEDDDTVAVGDLPDIPTFTIDDDEDL